MIVKLLLPIISHRQSSKLYCELKNSHIVIVVPTSKTNSSHYQKLMFTYPRQDRVEDLLSWFARTCSRRNSLYTRLAHCRMLKIHVGLGKHTNKLQRQLTVYHGSARIIKNKNENPGFVLRAIGNPTASGHSSAHTTTDDLRLSLVGLYMRLTDDCGLRGAVARLALIIHFAHSSIRSSVPKFDATPPFFDLPGLCCGFV